MFIGIDYSLNSPAYCLMPRRGASPDECTFAVFASKKAHMKIKEDNIIMLPRDGIKDGRVSDRYGLNSDVLFKNVPDFFVSSSDLVFIEGYSYASKSSSRDSICENTGVLKYRLGCVGVEAIPYAPGTIKKFATGSGSATKQMMYRSWIDAGGSDLMNILQAAHEDTNPLSDLVDSYFIALKGATDFG